jgi:hypothetical protein
MKKFNACHSFARLFHAKKNGAKTLCQMAAAAALALVLPTQAQAQTTNWLYFPFTDAPGSNTTASSTSLGGLGGVILTGYNGAGAKEDFHGAVGSGVNGAENGVRALCLTNGDGGTQPGNAANPPTSASAANCAADLNDPLLANTITNFVVSMWFNQPVKAPSGSGYVLPRLFVLSPSGGNDGTANSIGVKFQQENEFIFSIGAATTLTTVYSATTYPPGDFAINTWYYVAWAYDGATLSQYTGSASSPATLVNQVSASGLTVNLGGTPTLVIGNRNFEGSRGFDGWIQDFRFDTGVATNPAAYVEGIRQSGPAIILNVNFIDDAINTDWGGGNAPAPSAMSGAAVIGSAGDLWNGLGGFTYSPYPDNATYATVSGSMFYTDGARSAVTVSLAAPNGSYDNNAINWSSFSPFSWASLAAENASAGYPNTPYAALMGSLISTATGTNGFVNLGGLSPNAVYNLYVYSAGNAAGRASTFTVGGGGGTQVSTNDDVTTNLVSGVDYLEFSGVTADANGNLAIGFGNGGVSECDFNGFQLEFVSGTLPLTVSTPPTMTYTTNLNGLTLCTNTSIAFTAISGANTITNFSVKVVTSQLGSTITSTYLKSNFNANGTFSGTNVAGLNSSTATIALPLSQNLKYSVTVTATDSTGLTDTTTAAFDTFAPTLVIEASDFNFSGGQFIDTPANGGIWLYDNVVAEPGVDFYKGGAEGGGALFYRDLGQTMPPNYPYVTEAYADTFGEQKCAVASTNTILGTGDFPELGIGYNTIGDWFTYTRTFGPSGYPTDSATNGTYNVWLYMGISGGGVDATLSSVNPTTQALTTLGQFGTTSFAENDWNGYEYVPMTDTYGNLLSININNPGANTFQLTEGPNGNPNIGFLMLMPAIPVLTPGLSYLYPKGPFEPTNDFTFTVTPNDGSNILSSGIDLVVNGVDVSSKLSTTAAGSSWIVNYPLQSNQLYAAVISITNTAGIATIIPITFDTFNENNFQWEAVDYDFSTNNNTSFPPQQGSEIGPGWVSAQFIDNPEPSADVTATATSGPIGTELTNSYFGYPEAWTSSMDPYGAGAMAQQGIDVNFPNDGQTIAYEQYRWRDGVGAQLTTDTLRPKFTAAQSNLNDTNIGLFNICYYGAGFWLNYTRHYPAGSWYVWGRLAAAASYSNSFSEVISGLGTTNQTLMPLGTFTDTNASGYQAWHWIPLLDTNGNKVVVYLTGQATTFRTTALAGQNMEFFMLAPAPPAFTVTASVVAGQLNLAFPTETGHNYTVMYASTLTGPPSWTPVGSVIAGTGSVVNVLKGLTGTQGYYTVIVQ